MNIVMVSSETLPISKTGGLADVVFALSKEYVKENHHVSIITPYYKNMNNVFKKVKLVATFKTVMNWRETFTEVYHSYFKGMDFYLIKCDYYFGRDKFYGFYDDGERYAFFQNATIELLKKLPFKIDIVHCHDWQSAMIPCILKEKYRDFAGLNQIKTVLTIHNPLFKGYLYRDSLFDLYNLDVRLFDSGKVRLEDQVSTLKAGIVFADKITTVSPTHSEELLTKEGSKGLDYDLVLRRDDFSGILNGMDYQDFNSKTDKNLYFNYGSKNLEEGKSKNKVEFCKVYGLNPKIPLFAVISRLTDQKGVDLILAMADFIIHEGGNFALIGSGDKYIESQFEGLRAKYPNNVCLYIGYNEGLARKLYAASDFFIMPSAFEPCGLGQMIAQRYGSLPIVRRTGGLKDSVIPLSENDSNINIADGFGFDAYNAIDSIKVCAKALLIYSSKEDTFKKLRKNAFKVDHSWKKSAALYLDLYNKILQK